MVTHGDATADALLELPAAQTKAKEELDSIPAGIWVTVGLLAADGFALQLRLKRATKPSQRDRVDGTWHAYHAIGGAITLLNAVQRPEKQSAPLVTPMNELD